MAAATIAWGDGVQATGQTNNLVIGPFTLLGGQYALMGYSSGTFNVQLTGLTADGTTYVNLTAAPSTANYATINLPPGTYQFTCGASMTTGNFSLIRIPTRGA